MATAKFQLFPFITGAPIQVSGWHPRTPICTHKWSRHLASTIWRRAYSYSRPDKTGMPLGVVMLWTPGRPGRPGFRGCSRGLTAHRALFQDSQNSADLQATSRSVPTEWCALGPHPMAILALKVSRARDLARNTPFAAPSATLSSQERPR